MAELTTCCKLLNSLTDICSNNIFVYSTNTETRGNSRKFKNKMLSCCREIALQGELVLAKSGGLKLGNNTLWTL